MSFKIGDKVQFEKRLIVHTENFNEGDILEIVNIDYSNETYRCKNKKGMTNWFTKEELMEITTLVIDENLISFTTSDIVKSFKEENKMKFDKILDIYKKREISNIEESYERQTEETMSKDNINKKFNEYMDKIVDMFEKDEQGAPACLKLNSSELCTKKTKELIKDLKIQKVSELNQLNVLIEEVKAQLEPVDSYENGIKILKAYDILDKKGKIVNE